MNTTNFLNNENIKVLLDVIFDEGIIKSQSREFQDNILNLFKSNIKGFYDVESNKKNSLVDMNKKYILLILNYANKIIKTTDHNPGQSYSAAQSYRKIKILDEIPQKSVNELITYEEIQNDKRSQFDKDLNSRQEEFTNAMTLQVPPVPKFSDNLKDSPIAEIEKAIKELTSQRNYDVEQINRNNNIAITNSNADNWLKPKETSVKNDKITQPIQQGNNSRLKYIKTDDNDSNFQNQIISLDNKEQMSPKKNVTWDLKPYNYSNEFGKENDVLNEIKEVQLTMEELEKDDNISSDNDTNIFKLLKRVPLEKDKGSTEDKITLLQNEVKILNNKLDLILELFKK